MNDITHDKTITDKEQFRQLLAIALQYKKEEGTPKATAIGKGATAEQIIKVAKEHGIEIVQDEQLAQILSVIDVDDFIPFEAYSAVSEILAYLYKKNSKLRGT